jgi:hypothetical protein
MHINFLRCKPMETATEHSAETRRAAIEKYPPLGQLNRPCVPTEQAAHYMMRKPQTLRAWACLENGPLQPVRINGRLAWPVSELRRLLAVAA